MTRQQIQVQVMICPETLNTVVIILILEWRPQSRHLGMCRRQDSVVLGTEAAQTNHRVTI